MLKALVTGFEPFGGWKENSSRLCVERLKQRAGELPVQLTTRIYPVDFKRIGAAVRRDLTKDYDIAIHLGQNANSDRVALEEIGLNVKVGPNGESQPLITGAPLALKTDLPTTRWNKMLLDSGIPSTVSQHAGTYLCNAALFLSLYYAGKLKRKTRSLFIHLPLDPSQKDDSGQRMPSLAVETSANAVSLILRASR